MAMLTPGEMVKQGHTTLTRAILRDNKVAVKSIGSSFYNSNDFTHIYFIFALEKYLKDTGAANLNRIDIQNIWYEAKNQMKGENKIVIARTPDEVSDDYIRILDGGILHESFHSLYTQRGEVDVDRMASFFRDHFDSSLDYNNRGALLKRLWNVYEDGMIERRGVKEFRGAQHSLQCISEWVWEKEGPGRRGDDWKHSWNPLAHFTCYLRDKIKTHLEGAPFDEYDSDVVKIIKGEFAEEVREGQEALTSQDAFELAFRTLTKLLRLPKTAQAAKNYEPGDEGEPNEEEGDDTGDGGQAQAQDQSDDTGEAGDGEDEAEVSGTSGGDAGEESEEGGGEGEGSGEGSEGDAQDGEDEGEGEGEGEGDDAGGDSEDSGGEQSSQGGMEASSPLTDIDDNLIDSLANDEDAEGGKDINDLIDEQWEKETEGLPKTVMPFDPDADTIQYVRGGSVNLYRRLAAQVRGDTLAIRQKLLNYLRGEQKFKRQYKLERGPRLGRNVSDIITRENPKPFMRKVRSPKLHTAVSIVMDESDSMETNNYLTDARYMLICFAEMFRKTDVKFEVTGFTTGSRRAEDVMNDYFRNRDLTVGEEYLLKQKWKKEKKFTRMQSCRFRIFRTFDDPVDLNTLAKLTKTRGDSGTPLPSGMDFAARRLLQRPEHRRLLIVITDGQTGVCNASGLTQSDAYRIINSQIDLLEREGIETLFVGFKDGSASRAKNHIQVNSREEFAHKINEYILDRLRSR